MIRVLRHKIPILLLSLSLAACQDTQSTALDLHWGDIPDRPWPGPEFWANRIQDWEVRQGKLTVLSPLPMRTAHILTHRGVPEEGRISVTLRMGLLGANEDGRESIEPENTWSAGGFLVGAGGEALGYRRAALVHHSPGPGGGLFLGVDDGGHLMVADFSDGNRILARSDGALADVDSVELRVLIGEGDPGGADDSAEGDFTLSMSGHSLDAPDSPITLDVPGFTGSQLTGGMALASHTGEEDDTRAWFSRIQLGGLGVESHPNRRLGPILGAQHILSRNTLTLTAQLLPLSPLNPGPETITGDTVTLEVQDADGQWARAASAPVVVPGYTATFRLREWSGSEGVAYRLRLLADEEAGDPAHYSGFIRAEPLDGEEFVVAAFTGNHNVASPGVDRGAFDWERHLWFPHDDIVEHIQAQAPDFLFFSGDQVYEGASPTRADLEHPYEDYLYKWYLWFWAFRDLTAEIPSVAVPDDHDVFHGNVWGAGGRTTPPGLTGAAAQDQGGYKLPADWVNMVQRTQASHLPDPWDPTPSDQGIQFYFTDILYGGVSFAVLEDRKFKSPPKLLLPEADVWNGWAQNPAFDAPSQADAPGASLLGATQEEFLEEWASDWAGGAWMKVVLSQTVFGNVATIPADAMSGSVIPSLPIPEPGTYVPGDKMAADMDSNGWPQAGRDRALRAMRRGFAVHLAGDQHLASTIQYGVDGYGDGPFALCVPSVANFWPRRWYPPGPGGNRDPAAPAYTGDFQDGFGNFMTVFAVSNPARWGHEPATLHDRAPGYGIARFNRGTREVDLEAWPRWSDPAAGDSPYPGWPVHFQQEDGYGKDPLGYLPTLVVEGLTDPVVQVVSELGGEIVYTIRIRGFRFTPRVFEPGTYSLRVGEPGTDAMQVFLGLEATPEPGRSVEVRFGEEGE